MEIAAGTLKPPAMDSTALFDQIGDSILVTNHEGVIVYVNKAFEAMTGYSAAEAIGQTPAILSSGQHPPEVFADMWSTIRAGKTFRFIFLNRRKNGEDFHYGTNISPIRDTNGEI